MINSINNTFFGMKNLDVTNSTKSFWQKKDTMEATTEDGSDSQSQEASTEIMVVDGIKMLIVQHGMFKMKINLGPINLEIPKYGKEAESEKSDKGTTEKSGVNNNDPTNVSGLGNTLSKGESQYLQNDALASGLSTGMSFNAGA